MGFFSSIFRSHVQSKMPQVSFTTVYRESQGKNGEWGGWALDRFNSIVEAHSSVEDIVEEFEIDGEGSDYQSLDGYDNCYEQAYEEEYEKAEEFCDMIELELGITIDPEEMINWEIVDEKAWHYACELVQAWLDGDEWVPEEILDYAWYDLSDHN